MTRAFTVKLSDDVFSVLEKVKVLIAEHNGRFEGNEKGGAFSGDSFLGPIRGKYSRISDTEISICITEKPFIVPHSLIEYEIKRYVVKHF